MPTAPFLVGTPLPPERFVGRQLALQIVRGRLYNGESTALVGGPHIGKTSLLLYLARELCNAPATPDVCVEIDGHLISAGAQPSDFWAVVVNQVAELVHDPVVQLQVERVIESEFGSFVLERLFRLMARAGRRAVLLIDEFDALLAHANFNAAEFFGALRSLSSRTNGLVVITASRLGVAEMNQRSLQITGSPFFNTFREVRLLPLSPDEARSFLGEALTLAEVALSEADIEYLLAASGRHPYLLHAAGAALLEAGEAAGDARYAAANSALQRIAAPHFDDLWRSLDESQHAPLRRLAQAGASAPALAWPPADHAALRRLAEAGVIAPANGGWQIGAAGLLDWILDLPAPTDASHPANPPDLLDLTLRFVVGASADQILWESEAIGRRDSAFLPPFDGDTLPLVLRALDAIQIHDYPAGAPGFSADEQGALRALGLWAEGRVQPDAARRVGQMLFRALTTDAEGAAALRAARDLAAYEGRPLDYRLRFPAGAADLAGLPWELLWDDAGPLLLSRSRLSSCARYLDLPQALPPLRPRGQALSILAVGPHSGLDPDLRAEERAARQLAWQPLVESGALIVEELSPAVPQRLIERIQDGPPIDIIHYFGHGRYRNGKGELLFDRQGGGRVLLGAERVAALFGGARLALLFACQSSASGPAGLLTGVAPALVAAGVPAVVAMQLSVRADAAVRFAGRIYSALARGESLQQAVARARQVLFVEEEDGVSWFVPTLTIRSREARPIRLVGADA